MTATALRVLLVDDDRFAYSVVSMMVPDMLVPVELHWADTFEIGMARLRTEAFDVCLLDYQLGEKSGLDFIPAAREHGVATPIILLTGQGDRALDLEAMKAGAADFLVKGDFNAPLLERVLRYTAERHRTLDALRESEERYALAVRGTTDGLWDWKLSTNELYFAPRWKQLLGFQDAEFPNTLEAWHARVNADDLVDLKFALDEHLEGKTEHFESEHRVRHHDGTWRWMLCRGIAVRDAKGHPTRVAGSLTDVTTSRAHDPLTGLPNRKMYLDRLERTIERHRRHQSGFAVMFLDLDRFKVINDGLGHAAGDTLLVEIARRLINCLRTTDTVARLGGDEFTMLLEDVEGAEGAIRVARRILESLAIPFHIAGREVVSTGSIGIALSTAESHTADEILRDADTAMYRAKNGGRARYEIFDQKMHDEALAALQTETELRGALEYGQLELHYQPIYDITARRLTGFEALVRWQHPTRGLIAPASFIGIAEETGVIVAIDRWVMTVACTQLKRWQQARPDLCMSVNVSKRNLQARGFVDSISQSISNSQIDPRTLSLELTENAVLDNDEAASRMLGQLRSAGVRLVMDDFGTGYSSLAYLHRLPFSGLKIDRSFITRLGTGESLEIVRAIIGLARALGVSATAEGVETQAQLDKLIQLECAHAQGFFYAAPMTAAAAELLVNESA